MVFATVAMVVILGIVLSALPPRDDGLNWIRNHCPKEQIPDMWLTEGGGPAFLGKRHEFRLDTVPQTLVANMRLNLTQSRTDDHGEISGTTKDGWQVLLSQRNKILVCYRGEYLNRFEEVWLRTKTFLRLPW
jgi:hypothetical protein